MQVDVVPTESNTLFDEIEGAQVTCWLYDYDSISAYSKAIFYVKKYDWEIMKVIVHPKIVTEKDFIDRDIGLEHYNTAKKDGMSFFYAGWYKEGVSDETTFHQLNSSHSFDLQSYLTEQKKQNNRGRCLHVESGGRCNKIINAHSIQKNGVLSKIAENGKVYSLSKNISDIDITTGQVSFKKHGINRVSTFKGFCKYHDNLMFELIDNNPLEPTDEQIFLYAYRSLCKELFVKENSLNLLIKQYEDTKEHTAYEEQFSTMVKGTRLGFENLLRHKEAYDLVFKQKTFNEIEYCAFISQDSPSVAYSGVFYPEYSFKGSLIQNLSNDNNHLQLIAHFSAPTSDGWSHVFAWHKSSSIVSRHFIGTLAEKMHDNNDIGDLLFRFVVSTCENIAFSPTWWENLNDKKLKKIVSRASYMADPFTKLDPNYLVEGLSGISNWKFPFIYSQIEQ